MASQFSVDMKTSAVAFIQSGGRLLRSLTSGLCWLFPPAEERKASVFQEDLFRLQRPNLNQALDFPVQSFL